MAAKAGEHNEANKNGRFEANDLAFERNTPSTTNGLELVDGEAAKDCRVLIWNMCEGSGWFWICVGMVIVILTVLSGGPFANPFGQMTEVDRKRPTRMLRDDVQ